MATAPLTVAARPNWIAQRHERLASAIAFLKARAILVTAVDRYAPVRQYWVSGKRERKFAEDVIEIAQALGWSDAL